ncbi:MAG: oxidoreductase [Candidatus Ranarchaeia archaeon]
MTVNNSADKNTPSGKPKLAIYWAASCGGCDVAILDTEERILDIDANFELCLWPCATDFKFKDVEALPDKSIAVTLWNGSIRNSEEEHIAKLLRKKSQVVVAFGACAMLGGIPGLANLTNREETMEQAYVNAVTNEEEKRFPQENTEVPEGELHLPHIFDTVRSLDQVIPVEFYLPGCPPPTELIIALVEAYITKKLPPIGSTLGIDESLCKYCDRTKLEEKNITKFYRTHEIIADPKLCFLDQGLICLGPVTRSGCGEVCLKANVPCRGCFGPPSNIKDQGAKMVGILSSLVQTKDVAKFKKIYSDILDPTGTFYRFTLPTSILRRKKM